MDEFDRLELMEEIDLLRLYAPKLIEAMLEEDS